MAAFLGVLVIAGCEAFTPPTGEPSAAALETGEPSPTAASTLGPPRARPTVEHACEPYELTLESWTYIRLHRDGTRPDVVRQGLDGTRVIGGTRHDAGDWHQPAPRDAFPSDPAEVFRVNARRADAEGDPPLCIDTVAVHAAPFSPLAKDPEPADLIPLDVIGADEGHMTSVRFEAPSEPGEWVVRVILGFETDPGPTTWETFYRLLVDVPRPTPDGTATAPVACAPPGQDRPSAFISVDGEPWIEAESGSMTWRGTAADGFPPDGARVNAGVDAQLTIRTDRDICAGWWRVQLAPVQTVDYRYREPITDLVPDTIHNYYGTSPAQANRFHLDVVPRGNWVIEAAFLFARSRDRLLGQTTHFWHVVVD